MILRTAVLGFLFPEDNDNDHRECIPIGPDNIWIVSWSYLDWSVSYPDCFRIVFGLVGIVPRSFPDRVYNVPNADIKRCNRGLGHLVLVTLGINCVTKYLKFACNFQGEIASFSNIFDPILEPRCLWGPSPQRHRCLRGPSPQRHRGVQNRVENI